MDNQNNHPNIEMRKGQLWLIGAIILSLVGISFGCAPKEKLATDPNFNTALEQTPITGEELAKSTCPAEPGETLVETLTPAPKAEEYLYECSANLELGKTLLFTHYETGEGDCREGIGLLESVIESATAALKIESDNPEACYYRGMSRRWLEEDLTEAIKDLECAVAGLTGEKKAEAEKALADLRVMVSTSICLSMKPPVFAEDWDGDRPINPSEVFPANKTEEVWARWTLSKSCNQAAIVKWTHDSELVCQHPTDFEDGWTWGGSGWVADEEWIESGLWCMKVYVGPTLMTEGCFSIE